MIKHLDGTQQVIGRFSAVGWLGLWVITAGLTVTMSAKADERPTSNPASVPAKTVNTTLLPPRPPPLIEIGNPFFGPGNITHTIELPTGAVWTPTFILFGTYRTAFQAFHDPLTESGPLARAYADK